MTTEATLRKLLDQRILVIDGAMGTMIQAHQLDEAGYRGSRFTDLADSQKGNNDLLTLSRPEIIQFNSLELTVRMPQNRFRG